MLLNIQGNKWDFHSNGVSSVTPSLNDPDIVSFGAAASSFVVNGVTYNNAKDSLSNARNNMKIFGLGSSSFNAKGKLYYLNIYEGSTLVREYVPVKSTTGEIGLYDKVNGVFHANKGGGSFIAGPELDTNSITVKAGDRSILKLNNIYANTYTVKYNLNQDLSVIIGTTQFDVNISQIVNKATLFGDDCYYIGEDNKAYKNDGSIIGSKQFINMYGKYGLTNDSQIVDLTTNNTVGSSYYYLDAEGYLYSSDSDIKISEIKFKQIIGKYVIDDNGKVWEINGNSVSETLLVQNEIHNDTKYLYTGIIDASHSFYTFGTYSIINGPYSVKSSDYRYYSKDGKTIVLKDNAGAVADGLIVCNYTVNENGNNVNYNYEAFLNINGNLKSVMK